MAIKHVHILVVPNNDASKHQVPKRILDVLDDDNVVVSDRRIYMRESKWDVIKSELEIAS
jgi:hypothetical protein